MALKKCVFSGCSFQNTKSIILLYSAVLEGMCAYLYEKPKLTLSSTKENQNFIFSTLLQILLHSSE